MIPIKIATAFSYPLGPFVSSTDGATIVSALAIGTSNVRLTKNGGAWLSKSTATTPAYAELGYYTVTFTATDLETQGHTRVAVSMTSAGGALPIWQDFWVSETSELAVALTSGARSTAIDLIWDEATTGHGTVGTAGASIAFPTSSVSFLAAAQTALVTAVTTSVWAEALASHTTAGGAGYYIVTNLLTPTSAVKLSSTAIDLIWDEATTGHGTVGTAGASLAFPTSSVSFLAAAQTGLVTAMTTAVWAEALAGHTTAGGAGYYIVTNLLTPTSAVKLSSTAIDLIWDEEIAAGHATTNTAGERLTAASAAAGLGSTAVRDAVWNAARATYASTGTFGELVDAIWDESLAGHGTTNTAGERLATAAVAAASSDPWAIATTGTAYTSTQFGGRLDALVSSRASTSSLLSTTEVRDSVWNAVRATYATAGTFGEVIASSDLVDDIWDEALATHATTATAGERLTAAALGSSDWAKTTDMASLLTASSAIQAKTTNLPATPASSTSFLNWAMSTDMASALTASSAIQAKTTNLPATPASSTSFLNWAMSTDMGTALTALSAIEAATTTLPLVPAGSSHFKDWSMSTDMGTALLALSAIEAATTLLPAAPAGSSNFTALMTSTGSTQMADAVWNVISESTQTHADQIRTMRSALAGEATGGGTATIKFRDAADTIDRLTFTATTAGNRTAVVLVTT